MMWRRLADRVTPPETVKDVGRVYWRLLRPGVSRTSVTANVVTIRLSVALPPQPNWQRWPTMHDFMSKALRQYAAAVEARLLAQLGRA